MIRSPSNIAIADTCPHCGRRIWFKEEPHKSARRYYGPKWFRDMFKQILGKYVLGTYYIAHCEVCGKSVAVFSDNSGMFYDEVVVLYACTLLSVPLDKEKCEESICYGCELKKGEFYVRKQ